MSQIFSVKLSAISYNNKIMATTINRTRENFIAEENQKASLLYYLKAKKNSELRIAALRKLIHEDKLQNFELNPIQLKGILSLVSEHHLFNALELLVKHFAIITLNTKELKNIELKSTQLISILSLFHTLNRGIVFKVLIRLFANPELTALKNFELEAAQLKAFLFMFAKSDRFEALKLFKKNFDIKIHLTESDIRELEACLARDTAFNDLLPFNKKKILDNFFVKHEKVSDTHLMQHKNVTSSFTKPKNPRGNMPSHQSNTSQKRVSQNKLSEPLSLETLKCKQLRCRFDFFKNYVKAHKNQAIFFKNVDELHGFIKIFPQHDAIEFLNLSYIKAQIKIFQQQKAHLSIEAYNDLLNYLPNYLDKKLLSPISPDIKSVLLQRGIFKKLEPSRMLPDIISSCNKLVNS